LQRLVLRAVGALQVRALALTSVAALLSSPATAAGLGGGGGGPGGGGAAAAAGGGGSGSGGWRVALEALRRAAADSSPAVVEQSLGALELAVAALYRPTTSVPPGHECYRDTLRGLLTAIRNPVAADAGPAAVRLLLAVGARLAARPRSPTPPHARARAHHSGSLTRALSGGGDAVLGGAPHAALAAAPPSRAPLLDRLAAAPPPHAHAAPDEWGLLLECLADVAALPSPRLMAAATEAALELMGAHGVAHWGAAPWRLLLVRSDSCDHSPVVLQAGVA
jgi:hypothetical protein